MSATPNPTEGAPINPVLLNLLRKRKSYRLRRPKLDPVHPPVEVTLEPVVEAQTSESDTKELKTLREEMVVSRARALAAEQQVKLMEARVAEAKESLALRDKTVDDARKVIEDARGKLQRAKADIDAQRSRHLREKEDIQKLANEELLRRLFPVLDNFIFAIETMKSGQSVEMMRDGVTMIFRELEKVLAESGLETSGKVGENFDPQVHDAVSAEEDQTKKNNTVLQVMRPGYLLNGKALRPAMVVVNRFAEIALAPETPPPHEDEPTVVAEAVPDKVADEDFKRIPAPAPPDENESPLDRARRMFDTRF